MDDFLSHDRWSDFGALEITENPRNSGSEKYKSHKSNKKHGNKTWSDSARITAVPIHRAGPW